MLCLHFTVMGLLTGACWNPVSSIRFPGPYNTTVQGLLPDYL